MKLFKLFGLAAALLGAASGFAQDLAAGDPPPRMRPIVLQAREAAVPVQLARARVDVLVVGRLARTTVELTFRNPNARVLEGELQFPLLDGQQVSGLALDFDGKWRSAVPVEKARGQAIFEETIRQRVDPALIEVTQGNNYKLRVYPLPAQGERKVAIAITERLASRRDGTAVLRLPLAFGAQKLDHFELSVRAPGQKAAAARVVRGLPEARWVDEDGASLQIQRRDYRPENLAEIAFKTPASALVTTEQVDGQHYFYADLPALDLPTAPRPQPRHLHIVWDASGSGATRDHGREFALLDQYFKTIGHTGVTLTLARDVAEAAGQFVVNKGDWSALRKALEQVVYDGGTNLKAMAAAKEADAVMLFSDGLGNYGTPGMPAFTVPLLAVSAAVSSDQERLRHAAQESGGAFVDLLQTAPAAAVATLTRVEARVLRLQSNGARDLIASPVDKASGRLALAGVLTEPVATVVIDWLDPKGGQRRQEVVIKRAGALAAHFAAQAWGRLRVNALLPEAMLNQSEIVRLGKRFGLVTPGTSLIVLDRVEDYVRHEIVPPAELREAYERLIGQRRQQVERDRSAHLEDIVRRFKEKQAWWDKDFPKGEPPRPESKRDANFNVAQRAGALAESVAPADAAPPPPPRPALAASPAPAASGRVAAKKASAPSSGPAGASREEAPVASIQLKKWQPDAPYAERLRKAEEAQLYRTYLDERPGYVTSTAFFLDAADVFFERGKPELALRILSNLAEMDLENRHILRILGYRLQQAKRADLAIPVLQRVRELAPEEPQSWRDLGLAQAENGQRQKAVESLLQVVVKPWHNRFPDIELVALAELNAIIATSPEKLDVSAIDPRLQRNLPLDLRVVLAWDADNTDIDLYVTDPNGEQAYFGHRLTYQGGAMSRDFTGGYGPEEFSLRKAKPGKYRVQARFFGHRQQVVAGATTLNLRLFTGFGTPQQKEEQVTLRLKGQGEMVNVGEFVVGNP